MQGVATEQTPLPAHFKSGLSFLCVDGVLILFTCPLSANGSAQGTNPK